MLELQYRPRAALDVESIVLYIGEVLKSPAAAKDIYNKLIEGIEGLREMPNKGKLLKDAMLDREYRWILVDNYRIFYTHDAKVLTIWRIVHTRQDINDFALIEFD